ncbi:hypothetical protein JXA32_15460 [Candidatus Sumerlaeota bacterium]|nr:hypothetical protein [Candidatus Sumerlaeota bacterium]
MPEATIATIDPLFAEIYLSALRESELKVYPKEENLDAWVRSVDIQLIYDDSNQLEEARRIIEELQLE